MKSCGNSKCKQINPQKLDSFSKSKKLKDGLQAYCKACCNSYGKENYKKNKTDKLAYQESYYKANKKDINAYNLLYKKLNNDDLKIKNKEYQKDNKDKIKKYKKEYSKNNRGLFNAIAAKRYCAKIQATPP